MKIAIVAPSPVPFVIGGAEKLFWGLVKNLNRYTPHLVELIKLPCKDDDFWGLMEGYRNFSKLDLSSYDIVISTKYPAWIVYHPNHHCYMQHPCRGLYDLYRGSLEDLIPHSDLIPLVKLMRQFPPSRELLPEFFDILFSLRHNSSIPESILTLPSSFSRTLVRWLDSIALNPSYIKSYSAISQTVANREGYFPEGVNVKVIHHPSDLEGFREGNYEYIFTASRLTPLKRIDLLIKAFKLIDKDIPFFIAGCGGLEASLKELADGDERIKFLGFINDEEMIRCYSNALFVPFVPYNEDYGLITIEAMHSAKAVLTTHDSGGVNELVIHGENGLSVDPSEEALAKAMSYLVENREETIKMGKKAKQTVSHINWENFVNSLMNHIYNHMKEDKKIWHGWNKPKRILIVNTFPVFPPISGGRIRIFHIARALSCRSEVVILTLAPCEASEVREHVIDHNLREISIPRSKAHADKDREWSCALKISAQDVSAIDSWHLTPSFIKLFQDLSSSSDLVIISHPYLIKAVRTLYQGPLWYDAHNVEIDLKSQIFPPSERRNEALALIREVEEACVAESLLIFTCSEEDKTKLMEIYKASSEKILVIPNGISRDDVFLLVPEEREKLRSRLGIFPHPIFIFMGSYHGPNNEAALWLCELAPYFSEALFIIIGSACEVLKSSTLPSNLIPLGLVSNDVKSILLNAAHIALNPVQSGSGTNIKMLEYAAYELPILTTKIGNRGLAFENGKDIIISDRSLWHEKLEELLYKLSHEPETLTLIGKRARETAISLYEWSKLTKIILEYL